MRIKAACLGIYLVLSGCSSGEESHPTGDNKVNVEKTLENSPTKKPLAKTNEQLMSDGDGGLQAPPSRSELRVISEETKTAEEHAKNLIDKFDNNLNDLGQRKAAEAEFKQMLPEYKEKMLQLGKAQLKDGK